MSDDDRELDIEGGGKREHHNALERRRRDHIKDSFSSLRDSVPSLHGEKVASRAFILKKAADYIQHMRNKNTAHQHDIADLKRQNSLLETQIRTLEKTRPVGVFPSLDDDESDVDVGETSDQDDHNDLEEEEEEDIDVDGLLDTNIEHP